MTHLSKNIILFLTVASFASCNDWLDVTPRTEIKSSVNYQDEQGYKDALTGIYLSMTETSVYGKELTYGMVDVLSQMYTGISSTSHAYYNDAHYAYDETNCESRINALWSKGYNVIANINELISHIETVDSGIFSGRNYHLIRGEVYGLRAMLHFDLLRLFGASYKSGAQSLAIPYVTTSGTDVTPLSSVEEVLNKALGDLTIAESELAIDPVIADVPPADNDDEVYQRDRTFKFNYYAVKMLQARILQYKDDYAEAAEAAKTVINQVAFTWVPESEISTTDPYYRNYVFSEELVFALYMSNLYDLYTETFTSNSGLYIAEESYDALYEMETYGTFTDYRYVYQTEELAEMRVSNKLKQPVNANLLYHFRLPLMRISEAYYIAAECALRQDKDVATAVSYLNTVRQHRGLTADLPASLTPAEVENEIYKEYAKEFCCEGQLFFYFKRNDYAQIPVTAAVGASVVTTYVTPDYVLPLPDDEIEYGGRTDELQK